MHAWSGLETRAPGRGDAHLVCSGYCWSGRRFIGCDSSSCAREMPIGMPDTLSKIYGGLDDLGSAEGYLDEILEIREQIRLFEGCSQEEIQLVCHHLHCFAVPRNHQLIEAGKGGNFLLLLLTGAAEIRGNIPGIGVEKIADVVPGTALGEASLVDGKPHLVSCFTTLPTDFAVLTREALNSLMLQHPRLGNKLLLTLLAMLAQRLRETVNRESPSAVARDSANRVLCD